MVFTENSRGEHGEACVPKLELEKHPETYQIITQHQRDISNFSILNFIVHVLDFWFLQSRNPRFDMQWPLIKLIGRFVKHARSSTVHLFKSWG